MAVPRFRVVPEVEQPAPAVVLKTMHDLKDVPLPDPVIRRAGDDMGSVVAEGEVGVISGQGGIGKSTIALSLAVASAEAWEADRTEGDACGLTVKAGPVIVAGFEDSLPRLYNRARWYTDADLSTLHFWERPQPLLCGDGRTSDGLVESPAWDAFWSAVETASAKLIVLDPASELLADASHNSEMAVRTLLRGMVERAAGLGCAVLLIAHDNKSARAAVAKGQDPGAGAIAGASGWYDRVRSALYVLRPSVDDTRLLVRCTKSNYGPNGWGVVLDERWSPHGDYRGIRFRRHLTAVEASKVGAEGWNAI